MIIVLIIFGQIFGQIVQEYTHNGHIVGSHELYRIDSEYEKIQYHDRIKLDYMIIKQRNQSFGEIIHLCQQYQEQTRATNIWLLSRENNTIFVRQIQWENLRNQSILFQMTNKQLECYQIDTLQQFLILDCRENNLDFLYFIDLKSQSFYKYYLQQIEQLVPVRKITILKNHDKIFIIRGDILQAYMFESIGKIKLLYSKIVDINQKFIEWNEQFKRIVYQIDSQNEQYMKNYRTHLLFDEKTVYWNENLMISLCDLQLQYCKDLIFINQVIDMRINQQQQLMVQAQDFVYLYFFQNNQSSLINGSDSMLFNLHLNQLLIIDSNTIILYQIDTEFNNFIRLDNGSLLLNCDPSNQIQKYYKNDISKFILTTRNKIQISTSFFQNYNQEFPFIGGSLEFTYESQYMDIRVEYISFQEEFNCHQVYLIQINNNYYLYCLVDNQLHIYENLQGQYLKILIQEINGTIVQIYTQINHICMNIYNNKTKIICSKFNQDNDLVVEYNEQGISYGFSTILWLEDQILHIQIHEWMNYIWFDKSYSFKYEQNLIIVFSQMYIYVLNITNNQFDKVVIIEKCLNFIDFICLLKYCVQVCASEIQKYVKLQDHLLYIGQIELYHKVLHNKMKVVSSSIDYFYVWDEMQILLFSTYNPLNQGFVTTIKFENIQNFYALNKILCVQFTDNVKCYKLNTQLIVQFHEKLYNNSTSQLCAFNYYDKKCVTLELKYYNREKDIIISNKRMIINIKQNQHQINLGHNFYLGNVDGISSNLHFQNRQQTIKVFYFLRFKSSLLLDNLYILLSDNSILFYDILQNESKFFYINESCNNIFPIKNYVYFQCYGDHDLIYECLQNNCSFHSYHKSLNIRLSTIKAYGNYTLAKSVLDKITIFQWYNNSIQYDSFQMIQFKLFDYCMIDQQLSVLQIDMNNVLQFIQNNVTTQFSIDEIFFNIDQSIKFNNLISLKFIDGYGNAYIKSIQQIFFFQFRIQQKPVFYGKIEYMNEKVDVKQLNDQYLLMLQTHQYILVYQFKLSDLNHEIFYKINLKLNEAACQDHLIYVHKSIIILQSIYQNNVQLKSVKFDYILDFEQPPQPQELTITLYNNQNSQQLTLIIQYENYEYFFGVYFIKKEPINTRMIFIQNKYISSHQFQDGLHIFLKFMLALLIQNHTKSK
ncbi:hypothetical protein pb186bvf_013675 [Paramecium bursaria]